MRNGIFANFIDIPKLASLKVLIDSLMVRILQQLVMITSKSDESLRKRLIDDLQNFRKWVATYEKDMKFGDMRERVEFVNYISILKSFLESYFYDALMHHIRTKQPLAEVLIARAGIIVEPVSWAKEMMKMGERVEPKD